MICLGIDGGMTGGLAVVALGNEAGGVAYLRPTLLAVAGVPTSGEGAKRRVDVRAVMRFIRQHPPDYCFMEAASAFPGQGVSSMFRYGRAIGALETVAQGLLIPLTLVQPAAWKAAHGLLKADKEASRQRALQLFPGQAEEFQLRSQHGKAESSLLAWYGCMWMRGTWSKQISRGRISTTGKSLVLFDEPPMAN